MSESTVYPVPPDFAARAHVNAEKYASMYAASVADPEAFWREHGKRLRWMRPYTKVKNVNWDISKTNNPADLHVKWFEDGMLNVSVNCIDRHLPAKADVTAFIFEGDDPSVSKHIPIIFFRPLNFLIFFFDIF
jgi:acetyl-CoA synthetase